MKKNVMGISLDDLKAEEAARQACLILELDTFGICAFIRTGMLLEAGENDAYKTLLENLSLGVIGDQEVLEAAGIKDVERQQEVENNRFLSCFLRLLSEKGRSVAVLTESEEEKKHALEYLERTYPELRVTGGFSLECTDDEDEAVNHLNGLDTDVILAELSIPRQEEFAFQNKKKLNAGLWVGMGKSRTGKKKAEKVPGFFEKLIEKRIFKKKVTQFLNEKE